MENCFICNDNFKSIRSLLNHVNVNHHLNSKDYYDLIYEKGNCKICGKPTNFINFKIGYRSYCSSKCAAISESTIQKRIRTNLEKYNCENISQIEEVKIKKINSYKNHIDITKEKVKATNQAKYGVDWFTQSEEFKHKSKISCIEKFGVDNYAKTQSWYNDFIAHKIENLELYTSLGYIPVQELLIKYGSGWYQHKLVPIEIYKNVAYVKKEYLNDIVKYSSHRYSKLELEFINFIKTISNCELILCSRKIIEPYELDIYIPELKLAIEINGNYRHSIENGCNQDYHLMKSLLCRDKHIRLIHIYEFEDFDQQKRLLKDLILGINNYPKNDFNKNNLIDNIPEPKIIYQNNKHTIYGAGKLW